MQVVMSKKCTPLWREARFEVKMNKRPQCRNRSCDVEKVHTVVARSTFRMQKVQHPRAGPLFDVAMSKKCTENRHGALLQVVVSKKCTPLWREVQNTSVSDHFWKLRCRKSARRCGANHMSNQNEQNTSVSEHFWKGDVEKVHTVVARSTFRSQNEQNTSVSEHFWKS